MMQRTVDLDEQRSLAFAEAGSGRPVLLIHGALATRLDWSPDFCEWLAARARVIALDRPGHGHSRRPRFEGTARVQARQIREALRAEMQAPALLVGHSFGALVALAYAEQFPGEVSGLLLLAPIGLPEVRPFEHMVLAPRATPILGPIVSQAARPLFGEAFLRSVHRLMFAPKPVPEPWHRRYPFDLVCDPEHLVREGEDGASISPLSPAGYLDLRRIRTPVRILAGEADQVVAPRRQALPLARLLTAARFAWAPGAGHMVHHQAEQQVREELDELLATGRDPA